MTRLRHRNNKLFKYLGSGRRVSCQCKKWPFLGQCSVQINMLEAANAICEQKRATVLRLAENAAKNSGKKQCSRESGITY